MPVWLREDVILAVHEAQLAEHGGSPGIRDVGLLRSELARPHNAKVYDDPDLADLAAIYAVAIARNHPFVDGNKRTAFMALELFLALNGMMLTAPDDACVATMIGVAAGALDEAALAAWVRANSTVSANS